MDLVNYKEIHIPHRINLLITYRDRFVNLSEEKRELYRDLHRCSKDISLLMIRFLLGELGIYLGKSDQKLSTYKSGHLFNLPRLSLREIESEPLYPSILDALKAANRAVAHFELAAVYHNYETTQDDQTLGEVISYTEEKIIANFYTSKVEFETIMEKPWNNMQRNRVQL